MQGSRDCTRQNGSMEHTKHVKDGNIQKTEILIFQEKMQKHSAFPVEIWQGSEHNKTHEEKH